MSSTETTTDDVNRSATPPIGWDGKTLQEMLEESEDLLDETGHYYGLDSLELKEEERFTYERLYSRLRGALVSARETALHVSASAIVREIGELCFQIYTPEGDCVALSTGIIVHVHTGSLAIKYMIREDYEHDRGINPGDIYCNNDSDLGNVHTADVHTLVPIFYDGELIAWVDGVTHEIDIGGHTKGNSLPTPTNRYEDGLYATCEKIGEDDEIFQDWEERAQRGTRTPMYWDLDEKCRLAGCHMLREAVHDIIDDVGADTFKQFMREVVEEGRNVLHERVKERSFPGEYRDVAFFPVPFEDEAWKPSAKRNTINHLPVNFEVQSDGGLGLDMTGASPPGNHAYNATKGSMEGGLWVTLTQCLLHDGKVNDGSYMAIDTNYPEGSIVNTEDHSRAYSLAWCTIIPTFNSMWSNYSQGFFARGYREEVVTGYSQTGDAYQGGGIDEETGEYFPVGPFEHSCQGLGASGVRDGLDYGYAVWNPESDMGDIEEWESIERRLHYLARKQKPNTAGHGKYRGGSGFEGLRTLIGSEDFSLLKDNRPGNIFATSGMHGGYPHPPSYSLRIHDTDLEEQFENQEPYPIHDSPPGSIDSEIEGEKPRTHRQVYFPNEFDDYDVVHYQTGGGPGYGDPLDRPIEKVVEDIEDGVYTPDIVENVYGVVGELDEDEREFELDEAATEQRREEIRQERIEDSRPASEFYDDERERLQNDVESIGEPTRNMYNDVFETSSEWAEEFREFWELNEAFSFEEVSQ